MNDRQSLIHRATDLVGAQRDREVYGSNRDWSYLNDPDALYVRRGSINARLVA